LAVIDAFLSQSHEIPNAESPEAEAGTRPDPLLALKRANRGVVRRLDQAVDLITTNGVQNVTGFAELQMAPACLRLMRNDDYLFR